MVYKLSAATTCTFYSQRYWGISGYLVCRPGFEPENCPIRNQWANYSAATFG